MLPRRVRTDHPDPVLFIKSRCISIPPASGQMKSLVLMSLHSSLDMNYRQLAFGLTRISFLGALNVQINPEGWKPREALPCSEKGTALVRTKWPNPLCSGSTAM